MNKIALMDNFLVDFSNLDKDDVNIILHTQGMVPLTKGEREYLKTLYNSFEDTLFLLESLIPLIKSNTDIQNTYKDCILNAIKSALSDGQGILGVEISNLGHGYNIEKEEVK